MLISVMFRDISQMPARSSGEFAETSYIRLRSISQQIHRENEVAKRCILSVLVFSGKQQCTDYWLTN